MPYKRRLLNTEFPFHITGRMNNRESFPLPLDEVWRVLGDYLFLLHHGFGFRLISFVLMPNHFHLICIDSQGLNLFAESADSTLNWLNENYKDQDRDALRGALRKAVFKLRLDPTNKRPSHLCDWESVPFDLKSSEK